jgi:two-component system NtrC family sensor kinase
MKKISLPLFWKFTIALVLIVVTFGSINALLIWKSVSSSLEAELDKRARFIAKSIASQAVTPLLYDDYVTLQKLLDDIKETDPTISYAFILSGKGKVIAHTFEDNVPSSLIKVNPVSSPGEVNTVLINPKNFDGNLIRDLTTPILDKSIGVVRIGLEEEGIQEEANGTINTLLGMVFFFLVVGILGALGFAYIITNPIKMISGAADKIDLNALQRREKIRIKIRQKILDKWKIFFRAEDEIDLLSQKFNDMIERLEKTYEELRKTQASLLQSEKLASIGTLVAGIAHEINNPVAGMQNCIRRIAKDPSNYEQTKKYLALMENASSKIDKVVNGLLNYSRKQDYVFKKVDLSNLIENALLLASFKLEKSRIIIEKKISRSYFVECSQTHIEQVLLNLLLNSIDAINERVASEPNAPRRITFDVRENNKFVILRVQDTGKGIGNEYIDKIFDPFFTTKKVGEGTGLGLSISYNIIKEHNGEIRVESTPDEGTTFIIYLQKESDER